MNEEKITIEGVEYDKDKLSYLLEKQERTKVYQKAYREANMEKCKRLQRSWYEKNRDYANNKQKARNAKERALLKIAKEYLGK